MQIELKHYISDIKPNFFNANLEIIEKILNNHKINVKKKFKVSFGNAQTIVFILEESNLIIEEYVLEGFVCLSLFTCVPGVQNKNALKEIIEKCYNIKSPKLKEIKHAIP